MMTCESPETPAEPLPAVLAIDPANPPGGRPTNLAPSVRKRRAPSRYMGIEILRAAAQSRLQQRFIEAHWRSSGWQGSTGSTSWSGNGEDDQPTSSARKG